MISSKSAEAPTEINKCIFKKEKHQVYLVLLAYSIVGIDSTMIKIKINKVRGTTHVNPFPYLSPWIFSDIQMYLCSKGSRVSKDNAVRDQYQK